MAENKNVNSSAVNLTINTTPQGQNADNALLAAIVEYIRQSGLNSSEIKGLISSVDELSTTEDIKELNQKQTKSIRASIYNARNSIVKRLNEIFESGDFVSREEEINTLLNSLASIDAKISQLFGEMAEDIKQVNGRQTKSIRTSIYNARDKVIEQIRSTDSNPKLVELQEIINAFVSQIDKRLNESTIAEATTSEQVAGLIKAVASLEEKVDRVLESRNTVSVASDETNQSISEAGEETNAPAVEQQEATNESSIEENEQTSSDTNVVNNESQENNSQEQVEVVDSIDNKDKKNRSNKETTTTDNTQDTEIQIEDKVSNDIAKPKLKKLKFVQKSLQQTKILSEPKQPWYKRFATFAIKHPILAVVAGAGLGVGLFGATCGVAAIAGGTGLLTAANMMLPSIPGFAGIGAVGGGAISLASNTLPKGKWGLVAKAGKLFGKVKKIDKKKQWIAEIENKQEKAKDLAREKHRQSKGLVRKLKVHRKVAKVHKLLERTAKKVGKLYQKKLVKTTTKALETKSKLNEKEIKRGKTQAVAGYLQKKRKAESKYLKGKIDAEELEEIVTDLDEDVTDLDGGEKGLKEVGNQYTFDAEALDAIKLADSKGKNKAFNAVKDNILSRNSRTTRSIGTRVVLDPDYLSSVIEEMKKRGETENIAEYEEQLALIRQQENEVEEFAESQGIEDFEAMTDFTEEDIAKLKEEQEKDL